MNDTSSAVKLLYYLNLSPKDKIINYIINNKKVFDFYIDIAVATTGDADVGKTTKYILKNLKYRG